MKKKNWFFILFFSMSVLSAEICEGSYSGCISSPLNISDNNMSTYYFKDTNYEFSSDMLNDDYIFNYVGTDRLIYGGTTYLERGKYYVITINGINYINFVSNSGFKFRKKLCGLTLDRRLFLFDGDRLIFKPRESSVFIYDDKDVFISAIKTSSFLTEGELCYDGQFFILQGDNKLKPWVEGKSDDGIDEWIEFTVKNTTESCLIEGFAILNGYVSFENLSLFEKNNRVKEFELSSPAIESVIKGTLKDVKDFQIIKLSKSINANESVFRFKIKSVYKGTKYDDTCISLIYPIASLPKGERF